MDHEEMAREELRAWLRLLMTPGIGPVTARKLLKAFASPQAVFAASAQAWAECVGGREVKALGRTPAGLDEQVDATLAWRDAEPNRHVLSLADARYPAVLLDLADPPLVLFAQGQLGLLSRPAVAMVGSRNPTVQGREHALAFAQAFSEAGVVVVSGLARGIDGAAHEGALQGPGGTIAVVGTGLDQVYPRAHQALAREITEHGLMLSEFLLGTPPLNPNFPKRNRIVAALARGTLVVEAATQSGSLITARLALEMGREVLAIPGSIHSPQSRGCHALIKQGAKLVETAQDVLEELHLQPFGQSLFASVGRAEPANDDAGASSEPADPVLAVMGYDPVSQEALSARTGWGPAELGVHLLELELMGMVARLPGQLFQRVGAA